MTHRFPIKEIAAQAGLGTATVDRALNGRAHVSARTKVRVAAALAELERQEHAISAKGRTVWIDVVAEAPARFTTALREEAEAAMTQMAPVVVRLRFTMQDVLTEAQMLAVLARIAKRGSQGVCLKARDTPAIRAAVADLMRRGIPVISVVTDIAGAYAYAGLDNAQAGRVAAALIAREVQDGAVLTSQSRDDFAGEATRIASFRAAMAERAPKVQIIATTDGGGLNHATGAAVGGVLAAQAALRAVYSVSGGNRAICAALTAAGVQPQIFVAHDLDADNLGLLTRGEITLVLHHDLVADMRGAFRHILRFHKLVVDKPDDGPAPLSDIQIILPENVPARFGV